MKSFFPLIKLLALFAVLYFIWDLSSFLMKSRSEEHLSHVPESADFILISDNKSIGKSIFTERLYHEDTFNKYVKLGDGSEKEIIEAAQNAGVDILGKTAFFSDNYEGVHYLGLIVSIENGEKFKEFVQDQMRKLTIPNTQLDYAYRGETGIICYSPDGGLDGICDYILSNKSPEYKKVKFRKGIAGLHSAENKKSSLLSPFHDLFPKMIEENDVQIHYGKKGFKFSSESILSDSEKSHFPSMISKVPGAFTKAGIYEISAQIKMEELAHYPALLEYIHFSVRDQDTSYTAELEDYLSGKFCFQVREENIFDRSFICALHLSNKSGLVAHLDTVPFIKKHKASQNYHWFDEGSKKPYLFGRIEGSYLFLSSDEQSLAKLNFNPKKAVDYLLSVNINMEQMIDKLDNPMMQDQIRKLNTLKEIKAKFKLNKAGNIAGETQLQFIRPNHPSIELLHLLSRYNEYKAVSDLFLAGLKFM
jgi:hypothetical protein